MLRRSIARDLLPLALTAVAALLVIVAIHHVFLVAPVEAHMGIVQKIFYFHVPAAFSMYLGAAACFAGSVMYLLRASDTRDAIARSGAEVAVIMGSIVLVTGPLWAVKAWGQYWTWDPRLTTSLISVLIYIAYTVLRAFGAEHEGERKFAAALGVLGALNLPIIHFSVQKWSGQHPRVISKGGGGLQHPDMRIAFALGLLAFASVAAVLFWARLRTHIAASRLERAERDALELGIGEED